MDTINTSTIQAAGGLLWREINGQRRLAVIHRPRHNDWTLPKGKLQPDEDLVSAARREVFEETGCQACVEGFAGTRAYPSREGYKVVSIWHMHCDSTCTFTLSAEVDDLQWLTESEAQACLTYPDEAVFLRSISTSVPTSFTPPIQYSPLPLCWWDRIQKRLPWRSVSYKRLADSMVAFRSEFAQQATRPCSPGIPAGWQSMVFSLLEQVELSLQNNDTEQGWRLYNAATRNALYGLPQPDRQVYADTLGFQVSSKLQGWRKESAQRLLMSTDGKIKTHMDLPSLIQATKILQEHFENVYIKLSSFRSQLLLLTLISLAVTIYLFVTGIPLVRVPAGNLLLLRYIILFGVLGATISGILSLANRRTVEYIPEQMASGWVALSRIAVGAAAALVVYAFLNAGLINIETSRLTSWAVLAVSFAAGFSERLLTRAVGAVGG